MKQEKIYRSPLFYVGDKYKLVQEIKTHFPKIIKRFIEPFVGGGTVYLNINAEEYLLNDIDKNVIDLHRFLCSYTGRENDFYKQIFSIIHKYQLSFSYQNDNIPLELKQQYKKTYFAHFNKENFNRLKEHYNQATKKNVAELYVLLIYGFNRMLRFNQQGNFNVPVGNVDFNVNTYNALSTYFLLNAEKRPRWYNQDFRDFIETINFQDGDFIYLDPPYLITFSEYNKLWDGQAEEDLLQVLDELNEMNVPFAISNVTHYKGKKNVRFIKWAKKYYCYSIKSNYISYHDNSIKSFREVLITNYDE
jgi:DNA adenine methylase